MKTSSTPIHESLFHFLKTGHLEHLNFEHTRLDMLDRFQETESVFFSSGKDWLPSIYKYGRMEFYFDGKTKDCKLEGIMFQPIPAPAENGLLQMEDYGWNHQTTLEDVVTFMKKNDIVYQEKTYPYDKETLLFLTEGGVSLFFDCQDTPGIYKFHKAGKFIHHV